MSPDVLQIQNLRVRYHTERGPVRAVEDVSLAIRAGERMGLVGESGSGKSTVVMSILRLIKPPGHIEAGEIWLSGPNSRGRRVDGASESHARVNLLALSNEEMRRIRLAEISLITQGSMNSLNPVTRIENQLIDGMKAHGAHLSGSQAKNRVRELLGWVGLRAEVAHMYPHELSGGMKQRVCIAIAASLKPKIIIADEPTSALDVVVQSRVMETLHRIQLELNSSMLLVGHDMGLMAQSVERVTVMYSGRVVEIAPVNDIFANPLHPYTKLLIGSLPSFEHRGEFRGIPGLPPSLLQRMEGCPFHPRCPYVMDRCRSEQPNLLGVAPNRQAACHLLCDERTA